MDVSSVISAYSSQLYGSQKQQSTQSITGQSNSSSSLTVQTAPTKQTTDTVSISPQALAMLANSKDYSPTEEAAESGANKTAELKLGLR